MYSDNPTADFHANEAYYDDWVDTAIKCDVCGELGDHQDAHACHGCGNVACHHCTNRCTDCDKWHCETCLTKVGKDSRNADEFRCVACLHADNVAKIIAVLEAMPATLTPEQAEAIWTDVAIKTRAAVNERTVRG